MSHKSRLHEICNSVIYDTNYSYKAKWLLLYFLTVISKKSNSVFHQLISTFGCSQQRQEQQLNQDRSLFFSNVKRVPKCLSGASLMIPQSLDTQVASILSPLALGFHSKECLRVQLKLQPSSLHFRQKECGWPTTFLMSFPERAIQ